MVICDDAGNVTAVQPGYTCKKGYFLAPAPLYCQRMSQRMNLMPRIVVVQLIIVPEHNQ
jgi:hypothetical protein